MTTTRDGRQWLAGAIGGLALLNAAFMLSAPQSWYETVPGVTGTGPFNPHFVADIGLAFLASGAGLLLFAWRRAWQLAAFAGSWFVVLHGGMHLLMLLRGMSHAPGTDVALVVLPAGLALWATWPRGVDLT